jgi:hypothetical protein
VTDDYDPYDRLEAAAEIITRHAEETDTRVRYETGNRRSLLWVHAVMGMLAGTQMALFGSATIIETVVGVWTRPVMATLGITGGLCLAAGLLSRPRSIPLEVAGLALVGLWDLAMACGLGFARIQQHNFAVIPLDRPLPPGYVSAYPVTVYAGLFALILIHLWTLRALRKGGLK